MLLEINENAKGIPHLMGTSNLQGMQICLAKMRHA